MKLTNEKVLELLNLKLETLKRIANEPVPNNTDWSKSERKNNAEIFADKLEQLIIYLEVIGNIGFKFLKKEAYQEQIDLADGFYEEFKNQFCALSWIWYRDDYGDRQEGWFVWVAPIEEI